MDDTLSDCIFFAPSCIYYIYLGLLEDEEQAEVISELIKTEDSEYGHSEGILWKPYYIDYIFLWLLEDDIKAASNVSLREMFGFWGSSWSISWIRLSISRRLGMCFRSINWCSC